MHHIHKFDFYCESSNLHKHKLRGQTYGELGFEIFHFHFFSGFTSYLGHIHYFSGITGFPIKTEFGHIHKMEGLLDIYNLHVHKYKNVTFEEIEYNNRKIKNKAFA